MLAKAPVHPTLPAVDLERAKLFYTEKLGLKTAPNQPPGGVLFVAGDDTQLFVYQRGLSLAKTRSPRLNPRNAR